MSAPKWFPDWSGEAVAIVACGPSAKSANIRAIEAVGMPTIAIKEAHTLFRKRPPTMVYGCDMPWWRHARGLPKYAGLKVSYPKQLATEYPDIKFVNVLGTGDELVMEPLGTVGGGGNSGFQALNLAVQFGASRIILVGFDMSGDDRIHFYGANTWLGSSNPNGVNFARWLKAMKTASLQLRDLGVEVTNASMVSAIGGFLREPLERTLERWQLTASGASSSGSIQERLMPMP
jgi:hypothetical protein